MPSAKDEIAMFNNPKLKAIRHKGSMCKAYVGSCKLVNSKLKREALKRIMEAIDTPGNCSGIVIEREIYE